MAMSRVRPAETNRSDGVQVGSRRGTRDRGTVRRADVSWHVSKLL